MANAAVQGRICRVAAFASFAKDVTRQICPFGTPCYASVDPYRQARELSNEAFDIGVTYCHSDTG